MITFKKGNLRVPKWNRRVFMVAGGMEEDQGRPLVGKMARNETNKTITSRN
jgi:hypothetical protein